jgi:hypothetical protein
MDAFVSNNLENSVLWLLRPFFLHHQRNNKADGGGDEEHNRANDEKKPGGSGIVTNRDEVQVSSKTDDEANCQQDAGKEEKLLQVDGFFQRELLVDGNPIIPAKKAYLPGTPF